MNAARVAGLAYLATNAASIAAGLFLPFQSIVDDPASHATLDAAASLPGFRVGLLCELATVAGDIPLIAALYMLVRQSGPGLALAALGWRLTETAMLAASVLASFDVLRLIGGLDGAASERRLLALQAVGAHGAAFNVALLFLGLGSAAFCWLLLRSGDIPGLLARWGVFASVLTALCAVVFIVQPGLAARAEPGCLMPIFAFEIAAGGWLLVVGGGRKQAVLL